MELKQAELKQAVESQRRQSAASKTYTDLENDNWTVGDALDLSTVADGIATKARTQRPHIIQIKQSLSYFDEDSIKCKLMFYFPCHVDKKLIHMHSKREKVDNRGTHGNKA